MAGCLHEKQTQHYKGQWHGFGPVSNCETVIFAVFDTTMRDGSKLFANSFKSSALTKSEHSLARTSYLTRSCFDREIVERGKPQKGALVGITCAKVDDIRRLRADYMTGIGNVRALCVLDRVDKGDIDAHATTGYAEVDVIGISEKQKQLGKVRVRIRMDLANTFSEIASPDHRQWPRYSEILLKRIASIMRVLRVMASSATPMS